MLQQERRSGWQTECTSIILSPSPAREGVCERVGHRKLIRLDFDSMHHGSYYPLIIAVDSDSGETFTISRCDPVLLHGKLFVNM